MILSKRSEKPPSTLARDRGDKKSYVQQRALDERTLDG